MQVQGLGYFGGPIRAWGAAASQQCTACASDVAVGIEALLFSSI